MNNVDLNVATKTFGQSEQTKKDGAVRNSKFRFIELR